jgi:hypothetical protein
MAKNYGGENSPRFVNGVLGTIYREMESAGMMPNQSSPEVKNPPAEP